MSEIKVCAIDSEGDVGDKGFIGGSWYSDKSNGYTSSWSNFRDVLLEHAKDGYTLCAHNAEYDASVIFWQHNEHCRMVYFNNKFNHAEWFYDLYSSPCHIWDTVTLSGGLSLAKLGIAMELPKYDTPQTLLTSNVNRYAWICERHNIGECMECYATRDAEIVYRFMSAYIDFLALYGVDPKRTIGSAAISLWRKLDNLKPIWLRNDTHRSISRAAYYGGRVETFKLGLVQPCYTADVVSMYPFIMRHTPMPTPSGLQYNESRKLDDRWIAREGVTEATIYVPDTYVPVLPVQTNNRLYFPVGRIHGTWVNAEIRAAVERGARIEKVHRVLYSTSTELQFNNYIDEISAIRDNFKRSGDPRQLQAKILLNSLYGRIGMQDNQVEEHIEPMPNGAESSKFPDREWRVINGRIFMRLMINRISNHRYGNVLWAGTITAYARLHLLKHLESCGTDLIYCDTDSVFSRRPIKTTGDSLGDLSDLREWDRARIIAPKLYRLERDTGERVSRAKGVRSDFRDEYIDIGEVRYSQPYRARESMAHGATAGEWRTIVKRRRSNISKRYICDLDSAMSDSSYSETLPLSFSDEDTADELELPLDSVSASFS